MTKSENKKKLVVLLASYIRQRSGGAELQASYLCDQGLKKFDVHYVFISSGKPFEKQEQLSTHGIIGNRFNQRFTNLKYLYLWKIWQELKAIQPEYIYQRCGSALTGIAASYASRNKCQLIFHIAHDRDVELQSISHLLQKPWLLPEYFFTQYGIKKATKIIAQTQFQAEELERVYNRKAVVIANGHPVPDNILKTDNPITIVWIANWKPFKQPEVFVNLAERIGKRENVRFVMLGRNNEYKELVEKAIINNIKVRGEVSNNVVNDILSGAHILINTSRQEGFSNTFIQAWMRRVPIVSLQVNPDNIFHNEQIGYCSENFNQLVLDTVKLIENHELRNHMGQMAREYAIKHHSLQNMNKILNLMSH